MSILETLFRWPDGIVVGNLIASALWAAPALLHLHRKINRNHREIKATLGRDNASKDTESPGGYRVTDAGRVTAKRSTQGNARRQANLLRAVKHGWRPTRNR
jgi:hypothetical protein